jgi:hypothetical protein
MFPFKSAERPTMSTEQTVAGRRLWRILPVARPDDSTWIGLDIWAEVIVCADSAAEARIEAAKLTRDPHDPIGDLEKADRGGGFMSEKLYQVVPLPDAEAARYEHPGKGVVHAVRSDRSGH